jgi:Cation/multidrug efflux pump
MPQPSPLFSRPRSTGEVLDCAFRVFQASFLSCLPYGIASMVSGQLPNIYDIASGRGLRGADSGDFIWWALYVLGALASLVMLSAIILRQYAIATGQRPSTSGELRRALLKLPAVMLVMVLSGMVPGILMQLFATAGMLLGMVLVAVGALVVVVLLVVTWHVILIEDLSALRSMARSVRLVWGTWWRTLLILVIAFAILFVFYVLGAAFGALFSRGADIAIVTAASAVIVTALGAIASPFMCAVILAVYADLRTRREGVDLERRLATAAQD